MDVRIRRGSRNRGFFRRRNARDERGQSMVEFMLLFPMFITLVIGVMEFAIAMNGLMAVNFASREAALLAAEAGSDPGADCLILASVENDITPPASVTRIQQVRVYWANANGVEQAANVYSRTGSKSCTFPDGSTVTVPYSLTGLAAYPESDRCDVLAGCGGGHTSVDTIGVTITYRHGWVTPLAGLVTLNGTGMQFTHSNAMRMEPVL